MDMHLPKPNNCDIPFYCAASTTRSHNVGVNIQEVISTLKNTRRAHMGRETERRLGKSCQNLNDMPLGSLMYAVNERTKSFSRRSISSNSLGYGEYEDLKYLYDGISDGTTKPSTKNDEDADDVWDSTTIILNGDTNVNNQKIGSVSTTHVSNKQIQVGPNLHSSEESLQKAYLPQLKTGLSNERKSETKPPNKLKTYAQGLKSNKRPHQSITYQEIYGKKRDFKAKAKLKRSHTFSTSVHSRDSLIANENNCSEGFLLNPSLKNKMDNELSSDSQDLRLQTLGTVAKLKKIIRDGKAKTDGTKCECKTCTGPDIRELFKGVPDLFKTFPDEESSSYESGTLLHPGNVCVDNNKKVALQPNEKSHSIFNYHVDEMSTAAGKQNLQRVLIQLHDEFDALNRKYDHLSMLLTKGGYKEVRVELEKLDIELNKKEKEITTILALCKEVLKLKTQLSRVNTESKIQIADNTTSMSFFECDRLYNKATQRPHAILPYS